jgi:hypothetical protein
VRQRLAESGTRHTGLELDLNLSAGKEELVRKGLAMRKLPWTDDDKRKLRRLAGVVDRRKIAKEIGRSLGASCTSRKVEGLTKKNNPNTLVPEVDSADRNQPA